MEWRIIVPVLCLIGFLPVPGNSADTTVTAISPTNSTTNNSLTAFEFNIVFHIDRTFIETYSNMTNNDTIALKSTIIFEVTSVYTHLKNFERFDILQFRNGSIVVDGKLYFNSSDSKPIVVNLTQILHNGNFTFKILTNLTRITEVTTTAATANTSTTTQAATTLVGVEGYNLTFKMTGNFTNDLSNMSSSAATNLSNLIIVQLDGVFKSFKGYRHTFVRQFRNGSIAVDAGLEFEKVSSPTAKDLAKALADGVRNGAVTLPIDITTIQVTDSTGLTANKSPVLASMLTAFWMTLASLLLSAVMH